MEGKDTNNIKILTSGYLTLNGMLKDSPFAPVELDLGCGKGSFTSALAQKFPEKLILAADVMIGRLRKLQKRNARENIDNVIALRVEARSLLSIMLPDASLQRLHILCPDPWPKDKHRANRLLCSDFMAQVHRVLETDGVFHFASDDENYCRTLEKIVTSSGLFETDNQTIADIKDIKSDFENRWLEPQKSVKHFGWRKLLLRPRPPAGH